MGIKTFLLALTSLFVLTLNPFPECWSSEQPEMREHVFVDLVDLYITATDKKGNFITDLKAEEITVMEDGVPQRTLRFANSEGLRGEVPMSVAVMIDNSGSMYDDIEGLMKIDMAKETGLMLAGELSPLDQMMLITFDEKPQINPLTSDKTVINETLRSVRVRFGHTALYDAIITTVEELQQRQGRKILVICSDGVDNLSSHKIDDVFKALANTPELTVVVLGTVAKDAPSRARVKVQSLHDKGKGALQQVAERTAGYAFFPDSLKEVNQVRELIRSFVRSQYSLAYRSSNRNMNGAWRNIQMECKRKNVKLHHPKGYYAPKKQDVTELVRP